MLGLIIKSLCIPCKLSLVSSEIVLPLNIFNTSSEFLITYSDYRDRFHILTNPVECGILGLENITQGNWAIIKGFAYSANPFKMLVFYSSTL
jgi:hypothetical protein